MKRYAISFHGLSIGNSETGRTTNYVQSKEYFTKHVIRNDVDIFCHTWEPTDRMALAKDYNTKDTMVEPRKEFRGDIFLKSAYSRWYSAKQSFDLIEKYAKENNIEYDGVLSTRYDCCFLVDFPWEKLDTQRFWQSYWPDRPRTSAGYLDYWFYSGFENMKKLTRCFDNIDSIVNQYGNTSAHEIIEKHAINMGLDEKISQWGTQFKEFSLFRRLTNPNA